jgi:hypothetical protein
VQSGVRRYHEHPLTAAPENRMPDKRLPLVLAALSVAAVGGLILFQRGKSPEIQLDPRVGRECFERHQPALPPGAQYEGFSATANRVRVKVMTGIDIQTLECRLDAQGSLLSADAR